LNANNYLKNNWNALVHNTAEFILESPKKVSNLIEENLFQNEDINNPNVK
jgi:hypothetical protein